MADMPVTNAPAALQYGRIEQPNAEQAKKDKELARYDRQASAGLDTSGGQVNISYGPRPLRGRYAMRVFSEMGDDSTVGVLFFLIQNITRNVRWFVREHTTAKQDVDNKLFIESCLDDMDQPFDEFISSCLTMCQFGFAPHEIVYKKRLGKKPPDRHVAPSNYNDNKLGWAKFQLIGQDTIQKWDFDDNNTVLGVWQMAAPTYKAVRIDASRLWNCRTSNLFDNPQGLSPLRRAYEPWVDKRNAERIELIAAERDYCGVPVISAPIDILASADTVVTPDNEADVLAMRRLDESLTTIVRDVHTNGQQGIKMPMAYDMSGNPMFKLELLSSAGARSIDLDKIINRKKNDIWGTILADFLGLGQGSSTGSWAMHNDKTQLFLMGMRTYLRIIVETFNRVAIPKLFELNGIAADGYPELDHTPLDQVDIAQLGAAMQSFAAAGMPIFPNQEIEHRIYEILGLPAPANESGDDSANGLAVGQDDAAQPVQEVFQGDVVHPDGTVQQPPDQKPAPKAPPQNPDQRLAAQAKNPTPGFGRFTRS